MIALNNVDLPTLGRPTMTTEGSEDTAFYHRLDSDIVLLMLTRRTAILAPLAAAAIPAVPVRAAAGKLSLLVRDEQV